MNPSSDLIAIGRVVKPQGAPREIHVTSCWPHKGRFVLKFDGVDSIDAAEAYRGFEIRVPEDELPALPDGTYYHHELIGLRVQDPRGRDLGAVSALLETGGEAKVLVVRGPNGEALYPLAAHFVKKVDLPGGCLVLEPRETVDAAD